MGFNVSSYGQVVRVNLMENILSNSGLELIIRPEVGPAHVITEGVTVGEVDVVVGDEVFLANEYIEYTTLDGDLDSAGLWQKKATAKLAGAIRVSSRFVRFTVLD